MGCNMNSIVKRGIRERLSEAQNHRCCYCGGDLRISATIDHIRPRAFGGKNRMDNFVVACEPCNKARGYHNAWWFFYELQRLLKRGRTLQGARMKIRSMLHR